MKKSGRYLGVGRNKKRYRKSRFFNRIFSSQNFRWEEVIISQNLNKPMTNEQILILKKAIEKAEKNGFDEMRSQQKLKDRSGLDFEVYPIAYEYIIFSHDFCRAFWGEGIKEDTKKFKIENGKEVIYVTQWWQYHLQQMVLEKEPLKYLEKFL